MVLRKLTLLAALVATLALGQSAGVPGTAVTAGLAVSSRSDSGGGGQGRSVDFGDDQSGRVFPVPPDARVVRHYAGGRSGEGDTGSRGTEKLIYSNVGNPQQLRIYSPPLARARIGDDIFTNALSECLLNRYLIRVNGGVENGSSDTFDTIVALTTYCPSTDWYGPTIPGTELTFTNLDADINTIHELVIDFQDPNIGICSDDRGCRISDQDCPAASECVERTEPVVIPPEVWVRVEFNTASAGWVVGAPPIVGFSTDRYDNTFLGCNTWFGGWPDHIHASFYAQFYVPASCPIQFLAYLASDDQKPAYVDAQGATQRR